MLKACRDEIDKIDDELSALLEKRFQIVMEIGKLKSKGQIEDLEREGEILNRICKGRFREEINGIYSRIFELSKRLQSKH